jgi:FAD-dependent urate hydroxylase
VSKAAVAIVGAGPYGLSLSAHLAARGVKHRIFGRPMQFWDGIARAGGERYLKSYCFGTNISTPMLGYSFADFSRPRGLETFEPCSIAQFAEYGHWFQQHNVPWAEPVNVELIDRSQSQFEVHLNNGERFRVSNVVVATGLASFAHIPPELASLPPSVASHTSEIASFAAFKGRDVAIIGAGQSALETAALLHEAGARPQLLVREQRVLWQTRMSLKRSLWRRLRSPISGLGSGPTAWMLTNFPSAVRRLPEKWRAEFVKKHLPAEGAWWLRDRVETRVPLRTGITVIEARATAGQVTLDLRQANSGNQCQITVDHVIVGSGYNVDVERLWFIGAKLRGAIDRLERAPRLSAFFETSIPGFYFVGPSSAMSFGPLFRFVVGAEYAAQVVSARLAMAPRKVDGIA